MKSIVITPFDSDHAEELAGFIRNELDNADFPGEDMPASIAIRNIQALDFEVAALAHALDFLLSVTVDAMLAEGIALNDQQDMARGLALSVFKYMDEQKA